MPEHAEWLTARSIQLNSERSHLVVHLHSSSGRIRVAKRWRPSPRGQGEIARENSRKHGTTTPPPTPDCRVGSFPSRAPKSGDFATKIGGYIGMFRQDCVKQMLAFRADFTSWRISQLRSSTKQAC